MTYKQVRLVSCRYCGGGVRLDQGHLHRLPDRSFRDCTAPTRDDWEASREKIIVALEQELAEYKALIFEVNRAMYSLGFKGFE